MPSTENPTPEQQFEEFAKQFQKNKGSLGGVARLIGVIFFLSIFGDVLGEVGFDWLPVDPRNFYRMGGLVTLFLIVLAILIVSIRQVNQYERGVKFQFGKYKGLVEPGWRIVLPIVQSMVKVDIRTKVVDVPLQETITKDNVSARINAVLFYRVTSAPHAVIEVEDFTAAVSQLAQTTMRNVVGEMTLDEVLSSREATAERIREIVDKASDPWGIKVESVELKDVILPENMVRTIAKQAEAERERRAVIINSEGEVSAAENLRKAAEILAQSNGALHLRTLNSINDISSDQSNTVVFAVPLDVLRAFETWGKGRK